MRAVFPFLLAMTSAAACAPAAPPTLGDIPDIGVGIIEEPSQHSFDLCEWAGMFDSIVFGRVVAATIVDSPFEILTHTLTGEVADTCTGQVDPDGGAGVDIEIAVDQVVFGADPGPSTHARIGIHQEGVTIPFPSRGPDAALTWEFVGGSRSGDKTKDDPYGTPFVAGQQLGLALRSVNDDRSPVRWTFFVGPAQAFMPKGDALAFSAGSDFPPPELRNVADVDALANLVSKCSPRPAADSFSPPPSTAYSRFCVAASQ